MLQVAYKANCKKSTFEVYVSKCALLLLIAKIIDEICLIS